MEEQVQVVITLQSIRNDTDGAETYCGVIALPNSAETLAETVLRLERAFTPEVGRNAPGGHAGRGLAWTAQRRGG